MSDYEVFDSYCLKDGKEYVRLTSVLDRFPEPGLIDWKIRVGKKEANRISKIAMNIGSNVDEAIKAQIKGEKVKLKTKEAESCFEGWEKFRRDYGLSLGDFAVASRLFDERTMLCGEPDLLRPKLEEVLDIKCSSEIRPSYWLQTNWYAGRLCYYRRAVLRLDKSLGLYEYESRPYSPVDNKVVEGMAMAYRFFNSNEKEATYGGDSKQDSVTNG